MKEKKLFNPSGNMMNSEFFISIPNIQNQNVTSIGKVEPTTTVKPTAISEVNQAATEHNSTIDGNSGATTEEKAKAKEKVNGCDVVEV